MPNLRSRNDILDGLTLRQPPLRLLKLCLLLNQPPFVKLFL
jgi:hypothetical protein